MTDETSITPTPPETQQTDNAGLLSALQKERESNKDLRRQLRDLQSAIEGVDIEALKKESSRSARTAEQERERAMALEKQLGEVKAELTNQTKMAAIRQAFFDAGGRRSDATDATFLDLVANAAMKRVTVSEDGKLSVMKADGGIDIDPTTNQLRDLGGLMRELSQHSVYGVAFEPQSKASGSGLNGRGGTVPRTGDDWMKMTPAEMMQMARESQL